jgi:hypothetical protein
MATDAEKVKMYREKAKDTSIPQEVRNTYLDRANELERKAFEDTKKAPAAPETKLAKGGMAKKATPASKKPVVAIMIGVGKAAPKKTPDKYMEFSSKGKPKGMAPVKAMNKGGMAKKGKC